jgi:hypothetical protein
MTADLYHYEELQKAFHAANKLIEQHEDDNQRLRAEWAATLKKVGQLSSQRDQLLAALKFYADEENWREEGSVLHFGSQVRADEGEIARDAIAAVEKKP